jgi:brefeldin A-resistance guanine nucleotide exchange factor 1
MIHMGLSLLTVALEAGAHHLGNFTSLMNLVKDEMCKNLFMVNL